MSIEIWPDGVVVETHMKPRDIARANKDGAVTKAAIEAGMNLSRFLETIDPSEKWEANPDGSKLDAYGRQLRELDIRTVTDPIRGVFADTLSTFVRKGGRPLLHEYCARRWKEARWGQPMNPNSGGVARELNGRTIYTSADEGLGTIWRPIFEAAGARQERIEAPIPLSTIVASEMGITTDGYKTAFLDTPDADDIRKYRVGEMAEIPLTKIGVSENEIGIYKYGVGFALSYEAARRQPMDKISLWIQRAAIQDEVDKVEHGISVLIEGDGNSNSAASYNLTDLDPSATPGTLTVRAWLAFKSMFGNAYAMDTVFARQADWLDLQMLEYNGNNTMFYQTAGQYGAIRNINRNLGQAVGLGLLETIPVDKLVGVDTRWALGHVFEIGSEIQESQKFITSQTDVVVMTETEGFEVVDENATRILNLAA